MGFSETCTDADSDGICDSSYTLASGNVDYLPLRITTGGATTTTTTTSSTTTTTARWSGNGGGGGGGGAPTSFEAWINNVSANQTFDLEIDDRRRGHPIHQRPFLDRKTGNLLLEACHHGP